MKDFGSEVEAVVVHIVESCLPLSLLSRREGGWGRKVAFVCIAGSNFALTFSLDLKAGENPETFALRGQRG